jgi:peptidyl-prolyl cis-trans isomerase C
MNTRATMPARALARFAAVTLATIALAACQPAANNGATAAAPTGATNKAVESTAAPPPATVDGQPITHDALDFVARNNFSKKYDELGSEQRKKLVDDLVRIQLLANAAISKGKDKDADIVQSIELGRLNVLMQATLTEYLKDKQPTEAEVRAYYEQWIKDIPKMLYRIRVIGVQTQPYADDIVGELRKGGDFVAIARREASGEAAKQNAGASGWLSLSGVSPALANAISSLKLGQYTTDPVQLPEGWGIIRLEETRAAEKPEYDKVRQNLTRELLAKKVDTLVEELKKKAKIEQPTVKS